jgi:CheY-like chemotaxis protein
VGKGTGLGLAVVYGLVQQHGGTVDIETALGHGTTFHLYFPLQALPASTRAPAAGPSRRVETILVIEHDDRQRALAEEVLRETGYRVLAAGDGTQALRLHAEHAGAIDAVLLDVSLPDLPSQEVLTRLRQARPPVRILLVSSYLDRQLRAMESSLGTGPSLQKPYVPAQLLDQVRHLLSQPAPAGGDGAGRRRVLVVDDEPAVLVFCARALTAHHDVTTVPSGPAAVEALRRGAFDVLLTDVRMPQMDGLALIDQAVKIQPGLKVLAMSGSLTGDMEQRLCAAGVCRQVIRKPFSGEQLHAAIVACG